MLYPMYGIKLKNMHRILYTDMKTKKMKIKIRSSLRITDTAKAVREIAKVILTLAPEKEEDIVKLLEMAKDAKWRMDEITLSAILTDLRQIAESLGVETKIIVVP